MKQRNGRLPIDQIDEAAQGVSRSAGEATLILTRPPGDCWRSRRIRHLARRELLALVGEIDPWAFSIELDAAGWPVKDIHRDGRLGVPEREHRGRELATAGWAS